MSAPTQDHMRDVIAICSRDDLWGVVMLGAWSPYAIWQFIWSSASISTLIGCGALAIAVLTPPLIARFIPNLRIVALCVAAAAFYSSFVAGKFYHAGLQVKQTEWSRAIDAEVDHGEAARSDAESTVRALPPDSVRVDPWNRDSRVSGAKAR